MSSQKHEMLFSRFGINYNALPSRFRKGSVLVREQVTTFQPSILVFVCPLTHLTNQLSSGDETENSGELSLFHVPRANPLESLSLVRIFSFLHI